MSEETIGHAQRTLIDDPVLLIPDLRIQNRLPDETRLLRLEAAHAELYITAATHSLVEAHARAIKDVGAVAECFPSIEDDAIILAMSACFGLLCFVDDAIAQMRFDNARSMMTRGIIMLCRAAYPISTRQEVDRSGDLETPMTRLISAFIAHVKAILPHAVYMELMLAVSKLWNSLVLELRQRTGPEAFTDEKGYLALRKETIGLSPLFLLVRIHFQTQKLPDDQKAKLKKTMSKVKLAVGLQNDLVGLERDLADGESSNFMLLSGSRSAERIQEQRVRAIALHNQAVESAVAYWRDLASGHIKACGTCLLAFIQSHFLWAMTSRKYDPQPVNDVGASVMAEGSSISVRAYKLPVDPETLKRLLVEGQRDKSAA